MKKSLLAIAVFVLGLSGCATDQHVYSANGKCISCWNNPITGKPINHDGSTQVDKTAAAQDESFTNAEGATSTSGVIANHKGVKEYQTTFSVPVNVDIAFLKIKKEFNYYSEQEIRQEWGSLATAKMQTFEYAYDTSPSVYYHMRAERPHQGIYAIIDTRIEKKTNSTSQITLTYWLKDSSVNTTNFTRSLQDRARKSLNK